MFEKGAVTGASVVTCAALWGHRCHLRKSGIDGTAVDGDSWNDWSLWFNWNLNSGSLVKHRLIDEISWSSATSRTPVSAHQLDVVTLRESRDHHFCRARLGPGSRSMPWTLLLVACTRGEPTEASIGPSGICFEVCGMSDIIPHCCTALLPCDEPTEEVHAADP